MASVYTHKHVIWGLCFLFICPQRSIMVNMSLVVWPKLSIWNNRRSIQLFLYSSRIFDCPLLLWVPSQFEYSWRIISVEYLPMRIAAQMTISYLYLYCIHFHNVIGNFPFILCYAVLNDDDDDGNYLNPQCITDFHWICAP